MQRNATGERIDFELCRVVGDDFENRLRSFKCTTLFSSVVI
jgi:hypothetical protein